MALGLPSIEIAFKSKSITAIERSKRGIVALILKESDMKKFPASPYTVYGTTDVPEGLSDENKEQIELTLMGYQTTPKHILVYVQDETAADYNENLLELLHARWDYLVIPKIDDADVQKIATWIKSTRTIADKMVKAVLPNCPADFEGVVNFTNTKIVTKAKEYTTAQYCSRIAGIICGTPMAISCTYAPLPEVVDCDKYIKDQMDEKVGKGELFVIFDGRKYKIARGVNSLITTTQDKNDSFKKIKLIDCMDMIHDDIKDTTNESYIGKYANSYDNKCLLISAIQGYYMQLEIDGLLDKGKNDCQIDLESQKAYLLSNGDYTKAELAEAKDQEIKEANTRDKVFLSANIKILDAIEDVKLGVAV
ncbi:phage tail sheath C-terminal domain-containing protein [Anaerosinus massiliensis]|uniref:phage tail sheath C-terminal domain-containing protein n=1 Tax=Massilibacillus massiliensis TaxID=1806837 RepID=UPI000A874A1D|nr:phage tail sheath C-terminal domain-containing protein [Massilibacillus massiliensis]